MQDGIITRFQKKGIELLNRRNNILSFQIDSSLR